ncbi:MAG: hypothetical protein IPK50_13435 [Fibrobacterota bacterium]|nr:MAG: hypothetical protein IPK50_13435 [Fibrobacterota bacterium]
MEQGPHWNGFSTGSAKFESGWRDLSKVVLAPPPGYVGRCQANAAAETATGTKMISGE